MKIDLGIEASKDTFISWLTCALTAEQSIFEKCFGSSNLPVNDLKIRNAEIKLTINGVEFDAKPTLERLYEEFQRACDRAGLHYAQRVLGDAVKLKLEEHWPHEDLDK